MDGLIDVSYASLPSIPPRAITQFAFDRRFTITERAKVEMSALDDPSAAQAIREIAATVRALLGRSAKAEFIDLDFQDVQDAVNYFEAIGVLDSGRASEILSSPVQDFEKFTR
jgi:hypothetical protein